MLFGDVKLLTDEKGCEYLEWDKERGSKTRDGTNSHQRAFNGRAYAIDSDRCPVRLYKEFKRRRPKDTLHREARFFLTPIQAYRINGEIWYYSTGMGKNNLGKLMRDASILLNKINNNNNNNATNSTKTSRSKISNHCVRKTGISSLLDNGVHPIHVAQHTGHKTPDSLMHYNVASVTKRREMSDILNENDHGSATNLRPSPRPSPISSSFSSYAVEGGDTPIKSSRYAAPR